MNVRSSFHVVVLLALALIAASAAVAQPAESPSIGLARELVGEPAGEPLSGAALDLETHDVAALMRCPVCQGLSVADSPTTSAIAMREEARELLAAGFSGEQVLAYFERSYGEFIRLSPKPEGFNLVVWVLPVAALVVGALIVGLRIRRRVRDASDDLEDAAEAIPEDLAAYAERVRKEVSE